MAEPKPEPVLELEPEQCSVSSNKCIPKTENFDNER